MVEVTQEDRIAGARIAADPESNMPDFIAAPMLSGELDWTVTVQAFAAHRQAAFNAGRASVLAELESPTEAMVEAGGQAVHDTEDMCDTVWPASDNDDGYRGDGAHVRLCKAPDLYRLAASNGITAMIGAYKEAL